MSRKSILIVDDDPVFIRMLQNQLEVAGYDVLSAQDGAKGIQIARSKRPDLIIMDIVMPDIDGHKACEIIKRSSLTRNIPIIYLTVKDTPEDEALALELGAKFFIRKPYKFEAILSMIESTLENN